MVYFQCGWRERAEIAVHAPKLLQVQNIDNFYIPRRRHVKNYQKTIELSHFDFILKFGLYSALKYQLGKYSEKTDKILGLNQDIFVCATSMLN